MRKVLVTGGAGYLGRILVNHLIGLGHSVVVLDNLLYGQPPPENVGFYKGDITKLEDIVSASIGCDAIIALAAIVGDGACNIDIKRSFDVNVNGAKNTLIACEINNVPKMIYISTASVYGSGNGVLTEESITKPLSIYAHSRLDSENVLKDINKNVNITILRLGTLYGYSPRMRFDLVINTMVGSAVFDKKITVNNGEQWRPLTHINDAARAIVKSLETDNLPQTLNVVGRNIKIKNLAKIIHKELPGSELIINKDNVDTRNYSISGDLFKKYGFSPKYRIIDGVRDISKKIYNNELGNWRSDKYNNEPCLMRSVMTL